MTERDPREIEYEDLKVKLSVIIKEKDAVL